MNGIELLRARLDVAEVVARVANAQDDRDWTAFRALFADRVHVDLSRHLGGPPVDLTADELTTGSRAALGGFTSTQHALNNVVVDLAGDIARCRAGVTAHHHLATESGPEYVLMQGRWELALRRTAGRWLVETMVVVRTAPLEGRPDLYGLAVLEAEV